MSAGFNFGGGLYRGVRPEHNKHSAGSDADLREELQTCHAQVERLMMITEALWELLRDKTKYTDEDLIKKIAEIDLRDGKLDGRVEKVDQRVECENCGRTATRRRPFCLYCGAAIVIDPFAR